MSSKNKHSNRLRPEETIRVSVKFVRDGDSCVVDRIDHSDCSARSFEVRLHAIDAPEMEFNQPFSSAATDQLRKMIQGKSYTLRVWEPSDSFGRVVGVLYKNKLNLSVNRRLVRRGLAFHFPEFGEMRGLGLAEAQTLAKSEKRGVWQLPGGGTRPWDLRRLNCPSKVQPKTTSIQRGWSLAKALAGIWRWIFGRADRSHGIRTLAENIERRIVSRVAIGGSVKVRDDRGRERTLTIVGSAEIDPIRGRISTDSPAARALLGAKTGEKVKFQGPGREVSFEILKVL